MCSRCCGLLLCEFVKSILVWMRNARREWKGTPESGLALGLEGDSALAVPDYGRPQTFPRRRLGQTGPAKPQNRNRVDSWHSSQLGSAQTPVLCSALISPMFFFLPSCSSFSFFYLFPQNFSTCSSGSIILSFSLHLSLSQIYSTNFGFAL